MDSGHISDHDLERHYLGMITDEAELATLENICSAVRPARIEPRRRRTTSTRCARP